MKRITQKMLTEFIAKVSDIKPSRIQDNDAKWYYSKIDGSCITHVGMEDDLKFLLKKGITEQLQNSNNKEEHTTNIGFNPEEQKWYGWSHRAIYGFGIGSECKKGNCGYRAKDKDDFAESCLNFWADECSYSSGDEKTLFGVDENGVYGVYVIYTYNDKVPNKKLRGTRFDHFSPLPDEFGKGEWTATTLDEAKQMAIDFAESVS